MAFDPLSWAIGFSLSKGTTWLLGEIFSKELPSKLNKVTEEWAEKLPKEIFVYPAAIFDYAIIETEEHESLLRLRQKLNSKLIPEENEWLAALKEQWEFIKGKHSEPQPFFSVDYKDVKNHLAELSKNITIEIVSDNRYFNNEALKRIKQIQNQQNSDSKQISEIKKYFKDKDDWIFEPSDDNFADNPISINKYFQFSNCLVRSIYIDPLTKRIHRQINFRIKLREGHKPIYNINLNFYLLVKKLVNQPDGSIGYARNWHRLRLQEQDNYIPKLTNYWSISYYIDPRINEEESPFFKYHISESIIDVRLRLFLDGEINTGQRIFGEWEYDWGKETTIFGRFKLRKPGTVKLTDEMLNEILKLEEDSFEWPLLEINRIGE